MTAFLVTGTLLLPPPRHPDKSDKAISEKTTQDLRTSPTHVSLPALISGLNHPELLFGYILTVLLRNLLKVSSIKLLLRVISVSMGGFCPFYAKCGWKKAVILCEL
jgi:hypothetical protein